MSAGELLLENKLQSAAMVLRHNESTPFGNSGFAATTIHGPSYWMLSVVTDRLSQADARAWRAWLSRRGGGQTFTAWDLHRINPAGAIGTADGSIGLTIDAANSELDLTGTGAYEARVGDMISYRTEASGYFLGEIQADVDAVAGALTVPVLPRPRTAHGTPAVRRVRALGEFKITTVLDPFDDYIGRTLEFEAMQQIR